MAIQNAINANASTPISPTIGGTGVSNPTAHGILIGEGSSAATSLVLSAGQIPIGTTSSDPAGATLTAGTGISISSATGAITITNTCLLYTSQQQQQQQPQQQQQQMPTPDNTLGLAMLIAAGSGKSLGDTLPIAAEITYKQQMAQAEDAKRQQALYAQMQPEENVISNHVTGEYVKQRKQNGLVTGLSNIVPDAQGGQGMGGMANLIQQQRENPIPDSIAPMPETQNPNNPYITPRDKMDIRRCLLYTSRCV